MKKEELAQLRIDKPADAGGRPRPRRKRRLAFAAAAVVALLAGAGLVRRFQPANPVRVASASLTYPSQALTVLNASGYVVAQRRAAVASKATGRLVWLGVEEGSAVKSGQVIARLESEEPSAAKEQAAAGLRVTEAGLASATAALEQARAGREEAQASLEQARAERDDAERSLKRQKELFAVGITTRADLDAAETRYRRAAAGVAGAGAAVSVAERAIASAEAAVTSARSSIAASRAALRQAEVTLGYSLLRAPFDGVVLTKNADVGDVVTPIGSAANAKAAVVTLADLASVQVEADVSESNLGKIRPGQPCEILLDALPDRRFPGVLHTIVPTADRSKGTVMTKVRFLTPDRRILPEMSAKVAFLERALRPGEETARLTVNPRAVVNRGGRRVVYVVREGTVGERPVTLGPALGDGVEVSSGLAAGEKVVLSPPAKLRNGARVRIQEG
ncbi:MAG: efflux RND transporter periplasmic adaptor subunit [Deltaproteobacteria bacterium]|nr:efflux RND transporter periplasmic adaptor subunit [Deltaproteobacteria bacterium]